MPKHRNVTSPIGDGRRKGGGASTPDEPGVITGSWQCTTQSGILIDAEHEIWISGRTTALLPLPGGGVLVGAETGGVWSVDTNGSALALSDDWDHPNVFSLALGPRGTRHVFAGCQGALYETDHASGFPLLNWREITTLPPSSVYAIAVLEARASVVVATGDGLWMSPLADEPAAFAWHQLTDLPPGRYGTVIAGPGDAPITASWGGNGIWYGSFGRAGSLTMSPARIEDFDPKDNGRTTLASSPADRDIIYAITARPPQGRAARAARLEQPLELLRSTDGARSWVRVPVSIDLGNQAEHNQSIAVGLRDPRRVALGGRRAGPVLSADGGATWMMKHEGGKDSRMLHSDLNALAFDVNDPSDDTLYVGSDGGVVVTRDFGETFESGCNRSLPILQFLREPFGTASGSRDVPGLFGGGLQDNGNVYQKAAGEPWEQLDGGDGHCMMFLDNASLVHFANGTNGARGATWNGTAFVGGDLIPVTGGPAGAFEPKCDVVRSPRYRDADGRLLYAVGGIGTDMFGLFDAGKNEVHWVKLGSVPAGLSIEAAGADTGETVYAGTAGARLFAIDTASGGVTELNISAGLSGDISRYQLRSPIIIDGSLGFVRLHQWAGETEQIPMIDLAVSGQILRSRGLLKWEPLPAVPDTDGPVWAIASDRKQNPAALFAATDGAVWASYDDGDTWARLGSGLPRRPHSSDLRVVDTVAGRWLYLATYGRSVWRLQLA